MAERLFEGLSPVLIRAPYFVQEAQDEAAAQKAALDARQAELDRLAAALDARQVRDPSRFLHLSCL